MSKMFLRCAPDNEKMVFGGVPFRAKREMLARGVNACVRANEREQERERECSLGLCFFLVSSFFFARARARGRVAVNPRFHRK